MRTWEAASTVFFVYVAILAAGGRGRLAPARGRALGLALAGLGLTGISRALPPAALLHDWLIPPALLLIGYWASGCLFVRPMPALERSLCALDDTCRVRTIARHLPRWLAELLEVAYAGVYLLIPVALVLHLTLTPTPDVERFWAVILVTDYLCFGALPWLQTRPPRVLEAEDPWTSRFRRFNMHVVGAASIRVNTIPSGHAAEGLAAALLVLGAPPAVVMAMFVCGLAVSAGAVLGRYHYAADAITGWIVAVVVWWMV
jgi:hypothetical protein